MGNIAFGEKCHLWTMPEPAGRWGHRQKKKVTFLALKKITIKFSSGEKTPGMPERMAGMQRSPCSK